MDYGKIFSGEERLEAIKERVKGLFDEAWYNYITRRLDLSLIIYYAVDDFLSNRKGRFDRRLVEKHINTDDLLTRLRKAKLPSTFLLEDKNDMDAASKFYTFLLENRVRIKPVIFDMGENDLPESLSNLRHIRIKSRLRMRKKLLKAGLRLLPLLLGRVFTFSYRHELFLPPSREFYRVVNPFSIKESNFSIIKDIIFWREHKKREESVLAKITKHYD